MIDRKSADPLILGQHPDQQGIWSCVELKVDSYYRSRNSICSETTY